VSTLYAPVHPGFWGANIIIKSIVKTGSCGNTVAVKETVVRKTTVAKWDTVAEEETVSSADTVSAENTVAQGDTVTGRETVSLEDRVVALKNGEFGLAI